MPVKIFTLDEANALVPELIRIFDKITATRVKIGLIRESLDYSGQARPDFAEAPQKLMIKMNAMTEELKRHVNEVQAHGCVVKDLENYLVDFHSVIDSRPAFLCWRYGEEKIRYWHDQEAGYKGRIPLNAIRQEVK